MNKSDLRKEALERRLAMAASQRARFDRAIYARLVELEDVARARTILSYVSYRGEVDTRRAIRHWLSDRRRVCVPKVDRPAQAIVAVAIEDFDRDLAPGAYGVLEPVESQGRVTPPGEIDVMIVPGLVLDRRGHRIGYGAGYFDRFARRLGQRTVTIALAYHWQVRARLPNDEWDASVDRIVTERGVIEADAAPPVAAKRA